MLYMPCFVENKLPRRRIIHIFRRKSKERLYLSIIQTSRPGLGEAKGRKVHHSSTRRTSLLILIALQWTPPKLILFMKGDEVDMGVITVDECRIYCQSQGVLDCVMLLLASYYVFDIHYPRKYSQTLALLCGYSSLSWVMLTQASNRQSISTFSRNYVKQLKIKCLKHTSGYKINV